MQGSTDVSALDEGVVPELMPARMVAAYVYCPRLFYLEWVQSRFVENEDVAAGRAAHRVVDEQRGKVPPPGIDEELGRATSVLLSAPRFGLVSRIDVLERAGKEVVPVDFKVGRVPQRGPWPSDRVQLGVQALVLRENGYRCERGTIYYAGSRRRVEVPIDEGLVVETLEAAIAAREVAESEIPPPPLVDSPKCPRCSLVGICLPDEVNFLSGRTPSSPRRLVPSSSERRPLYVTEPGATVGRRGDRVVVWVGDDLVTEVRLLDVSQVCVFGRAQVTTALIHACFDEEIPVCWFSYGGWFRGMATGLPSKWSDVRMRQVAAAWRGSLDAARGFVFGKVRNARTLLRRNARSPVKETIAALGRLADAATRADSLGSLLGVEGTAARLYFGAFAAMLRSDLSFPGGPFAFEGRRRRPPPDAVNCLLGFTYALLVKDLTATVASVGLDPYIGLYHRPRFGRPALALDLAEEFRPLVAESVVLTLINNGEIRPNHFVASAGGVSLTSEGRRAVLAAYERRLEIEVRHPVFGYTASYRRTLEIQARILAAYLIGEFEQYTPFTTR